VVYADLRCIQNLSLQISALREVFQLEGIFKDTRQDQH
jgi:hypothetical protein